MHSSLINSSKYTTENYSIVLFLPALQILHGTGAVCRKLLIILWLEYMFKGYKTTIKLFIKPSLVQLDRSHQLTSTFSSARLCIYIKLLQQRLGRSNTHAFEKYVPSMAVKIIRGFLNQDHSINLLRKFKACYAINDDGCIFLSFCHLTMS